METRPTGTVYDYVALLSQNALWPILAIAFLIWIFRNPEVLGQISKLSFGGFALELRELKKEIAESREEIKVLENDLNLQRKTFEDVINGFDPHAPLEKLSETRAMLKAQSGQLDDLSVIADYLSANATSAELYAAAVALRERRPTAMFGPLTDCLDRIATKPDLNGFRLNTIWTLVSAMHRILIAAVKEKVAPKIELDQMRHARDVLQKLARNPRVLKDRPENPDKGVRGPIRHALSWIDRGLEAERNVTNSR